MTALRCHRDSWSMLASGRLGQGCGARAAPAVACYRVVELEGRGLGAVA
eukprot:CAMPEP_0183408018 /NCGR_PEP_ID=MMETSP0370-20130417/17772_1 /TAXON_ID=268820 /ORGANISM="Peridinium aciculiferum, Strain PAER-2" /LENGTH=48 /DNA_ID= /DNA_START= /DNA_END= /DNA_ORIENTATION=